MRRHLITFVAWATLMLLMPTPAPAQSACTYVQPGAILTAGQWNACFAAKLDSTANVVHAGTSAALAPTNAGSPTGTTSTGAYKMMGMGASCAITPIVSGRVLFTIAGNLGTSAGGDSVQAYGTYGSGAVPSNGASAAGTQFSSVDTENATLTSFGGRTFTAVVTGLTLGTPYWFDVALEAVTGGTASITNVYCSAVEIP
jgi:hypothetical protein